MLLGSMKRIHRTAGEIIKGIGVSQNLPPRGALAASAGVLLTLVAPSPDMLDRCASHAVCAEGGTEVENRARIAPQFCRVVACVPGTPARADISRRNSWAQMGARPL